MHMDFDRFFFASVVLVLDCIAHFLSHQPLNIVVGCFFFSPLIGISIIGLNAAPSVGVDTFKRLHRECAHC